MERDVEGFRALSKAILNDTKGEAQRIVGDAQQRAGVRNLEATQEAARVSQEILNRARNEVAQLEQQTLATARLEAQAVRLRRREELIQSVFERAVQQLALVREQPDYPTLLSNLIQDAVEQLGRPAEAILHVAASDRERLDEQALSQLAARWQGQVQLRLGEPAPITGGAIVESGDGRRRYDNSFEARLARERTRLRARVYQILQGER